MRNQAFSFILIFSLLLMPLSLSPVEAKPCKPSGKIKAKRRPPTSCSDCCEEGKYYNTYKCSPRVSTRTKAVLKFDAYRPGQDDVPSECDGKFHSDTELIVALSTGWFIHMKRCLRNITIYGNGKTVTAKVVDECDSTAGCDEEHDYMPPCANNVLDASTAVWRALGVPEKDWDNMDVHWFDA